MQVDGKIICVGNVQNFKSKDGLKEYTKLDFVVSPNVDDEYPDLFAIEAFGEDKVAAVKAFTRGDDVVVNYNAKAKLPENCEKVPEDHRFRGALSMRKIEADKGLPDNKAEEGKLPF